MKPIGTANDVLKPFGKINILRMGVFPRYVKTTKISSGWLVRLGIHFQSRWLREEDTC